MIFGEERKKGFNLRVFNSVGSDLIRYDRLGILQDGHWPSDIGVLLDTIIVARGGCHPFSIFCFFLRNERAATFRQMI